MANILTHPTNGTIYFDDGTAGSSSVPALTGDAVSLKYDGAAGLNIASYNTTSTDRFSIDGDNGRLFGVNDSLTGTIFSVNDAAGLPIIEVESTSTTDTITMGTYASNALVVAGDKVGIGDTTPSYKLDVNGTLRTTSAAYFNNDITVSNNAIISGNLTVSGTTTTIDTTNLRVEDHNIELGNVSSPTDITADGGGITLLAGSNEGDHKTIKWINSTDSWTSNQRFSAPNLTLTSLSAQNSEATALVVNGSNVVGTRELGTAAFSATSAFATAAQGTSAETAHGWGNHASAAYLTSSSTQSKYLRSDTSDSFTGTLTGGSLHAGGQITTSSAKLQVKGFQRTGTIYLHEGTSAGANNYPLATTSGGELQWNTNKVWHVGNDGSGSGLDADTLDGVQLNSLDHAESFKTYTGISASAGQARRHHIGRLYGCPAHWDSNWQNIEINATTETYESANLRFAIMGDYTGGNQNTMLKLYLKEAHGPLVTNFRFVLGTPVDAGWDHSGQNTYYVDLYAEVRSYAQFKLNIKTYGHPIYSTNPTSGGAYTVFYNTPTVTNISDFTETHSSTKHLDSTIWNSANDGSGSGLDADKLDGQEGSYYAPLASPALTGTPTASTPTLSDNSTKLATTEYVKSQSYLTSYTETDTLATVTGRGNTTSQAITISNQLSTTNTIFARKDNVTNYTDAQVRLDSFGGASSLSGLGFHISGQLGRMLFMNSSGNLFWNSTSSKIWHAGNDGSGSGLDADLLDGIEGNKFLRTTTAASSAGPGMADTTISIGDSGTSYAFVQSHGGKPLRINPAGNSVTIGSSNGTAWHSANDGSGSGLDADLLDGYQGSYYATTNDLALKLNLSGGTMTGTLTSRDVKIGSNYHLQRSNHHSGHLEGSYNSVGANEAKTNPIFTIGSSYNPNDASLGNMYGVGFGRVASASFLNFTGASGWGLYVAADGDARVFLDGSNGIVASTGEHYVGSNRVHHNGYHPNADTLTTARTIAGTSFNGSADINISYNNLTNKPTIPSLSGYATESYVGTQISNLIGGAPAALDTLNELAAAIGDDASYASSITTALSGKLSTTGKAADSDKLDGINSSSFLRSDATDTATGVLYLSNQGNHYSGHHYFDPYSDAGAHYPHYLNGSSGEAKVNVRVYNAGGGSYDILYFAAGNNNMTWRGNKIWNAANDGSGSGLDADLLDGNHASAFATSSQGTSAENALPKAGGTMTGDLQVNADVHSRNNTVDDETLFAITDFDTDASIRTKFNTTSTNFTKVDDSTAPASGVFKVTGAPNVYFGEYIPIDDETEIMFECWVKHVSGSDSTGNLYAGSDFYNGSKGHLGNNNRYWGSSGHAQDSDNTTWRHIKGVMKGSSIRASSSTSTAQYMKFLVLFNYATSGNASHFCGMKWTRSKKTVSSLWLKTSNSNAYSNSALQSSEAASAFNVIDTSGNIASPTQGLLWGASNDGSGSGLDADKLDGQQPSQSGGANRIAQYASNGYLNVGNWIHSANSTGIYWPSGLHLYENSGNLHINTSGGKYTSDNQGTLWGSSNDGSGSGLDADLLDGQQGSYYWSQGSNGLAGANRISSISNFNNSVPSGFYESSSASNMPASSWHNLINVRHSNTGNDHGFQLSMGYYSNHLYSRSYQGGTGSNNGTYATWAKQWSDQNDGSGSGLDADKLDAQEGSYYRNASNLNAGTVAAGRLSTATTQSSSENSTKIATTAYVKSQGYITSADGGNATTLDGIDSSAFLRSNANDTVSGAINFTFGQGAINITNSSILSSASSNWTGNPGGAGKIQYHSNRWYIVSDSSSNRIVQFRRNSSDVSYIANDGRFHGNVTGALTGNASTATQLATGRTIAGTSFDGSSNINISYNNLTNKPTIPTNNNQLTNGAGYVTTDTNTTYSAGRGLDLSGTQFLLETDLRDSISYIGYDSNDYVQWSNNSYFRSVVNGSERFRVNTSGIDVTGSATANFFRTDTSNTDYSLLTRNSNANAVLYVQSANSSTNQLVAMFNYGSTTAAGGNKVLVVGKDKSYFTNTKLGIGVTSPSTALHVSGTITHTIYSPTALPSASPAGQRAFAYSFYPLATSHGSVVSTNGSYVIPVYSDGSSWRAG